MNTEKCKNIIILLYSRKIIKELLLSSELIMWNNISYNGTLFKVNMHSIYVRIFTLL